MITKELLLDTGKKKGISNKSHIEKDYFQEIFLFNLYKRTNKLVFKGGTALYKLYGLSRFSEDLDFSIVENTSLDEVKEIIAATVKEGGFSIKSIKKTKDSLLIKISCTGVLTEYNTLRIDINFKNKIIRDADVRNFISEYADINPFSLRALKPEEIIAEKIHSIFMRERARDLFDLFFLLRISRFDRELVEEKLKIFDMTYDKKRLERKINAIGAVWESELKQFILAELPDFKVIKDFVLGRIA